MDTYLGSIPLVVDSILVAVNLSSYLNHSTVESEIPIVDWPSDDGSNCAVVVDYNSCSFHAMEPETECYHNSQKIWSLS